MKDINKAIMINDAMETGALQINSAPARGPDHFPFQVYILTYAYIGDNSERSTILFPLVPLVKDVEARSLGKY